MNQLKDIIYKILNYLLIASAILNILSALTYFTSPTLAKSLHYPKNQLNIYMVLSIVLGISFLIMAIFNLKIVHHTYHKKWPLILGIINILGLLILNGLVLKSYHSVIDVLKNCGVAVIVEVLSLTYFSKKSLLTKDQ